MGPRFPYTRIECRRLGDGGGLGDACDQGELGVVTIDGPTVSPGYRDPAQGAGTFQD